MDYDPTFDYEGFIRKNREHVIFRKRTALPLKERRNIATKLKIEKVTKKYNLAKMEARQTRSKTAKIIQDKKKAEEEEAACKPGCLSTVEPDGTMVIKLPGHEDIKLQRVSEGEKDGLKYFQSMDIRKFR